jgi:hypothetical protein
MDIIPSFTDKVERGEFSTKWSIHYTRLNVNSKKYFKGFQGFKKNNLVHIL